MATTEAAARPAPRPRGRPRSQECHQAILRAANELLDERRYADVTMEAIAERAQVAKQTLYKWWPSKARLAMEAFAARATARIPTPDSGSVEEDLLQLVRHTCRALTRGKLGALLAGLIAEAQSDPQLAIEFRDSYIGVRRRVGEALLQRGIERGEIAAGIDIPLSLDLIYGPIWYRLLLRNAPLDDAFAQSIVAHLLSTVARRPRRRSAA